MKVWLFSLIGVALTACSSDAVQDIAPDYITRNDFESMQGWVTEAGTLVKDRAHSGQYALRVDPQHEFSLTYNAVLGQATPRKLKAIKLEAWVLMPDKQANGVLVLQIVDPQQNNREIVGDGIRLSEVVKDYNRWVRVSKTIALPANIAYTHLLKVYLWRSDATSPVYMDDLSLQEIE